VTDSDTSGWDNVTVCCCSDHLQLSQAVSQSEVGCFHVLCNEAYFHSLNVLLCSHKVFVFHYKLTLTLLCFLRIFYIFVSRIWKVFGTNLGFYIETGFQSSWFQYSWHLEGKRGKSEDSDMGSDPGTLCVQYYYPFRIVLRVATKSSKWEDTLFWWPWCRCVMPVEFKVGAIGRLISHF
jgi:hypothetical protein